MRYALLASMLMFATGCDSDTSAVRSQSNTALLPNAGLGDDKAILAGEYYMGDGLGDNTSLTLRADGSFKCRWFGCTGVYAAAEGTWQLKDAAIRFSINGTNNLKGRLTIADVVGHKGHSLLVLEQDRDRFKKRGPSGYWCLHKRDTGEAVGWNYE